MRSVRSLLAAVLALAALTSSAAFAQTDSTQVSSPPAKSAKMSSAKGIEYMGGGYFVGACPMGDWGEIAGFGFGLDGTNITRKPGKPFALRSSLGLLYNFSRTVDVPAGNVGPSDKLSIETKNWSVFFGLGPEFSMPNKDVTPFIFGTVGFDTYWTSSELSGTAFGTSYSAQHGDSRIAFAWSGGLGFRRQVAPGHLAELSAEYRSGMRHDFLRPEDVNTSGGTVNAKRDSHTSDQIVVRLGTVFGGL
jgi:opacity protein-like surface antigen